MLAILIFVIALKFVTSAGEVFKFVPNESFLCKYLISEKRVKNVLVIAAHPGSVSIRNIFLSVRFTTRTSFLYSE